MFTKKHMILAVALVAGLSDINGFWRSSSGNKQEVPSFTKMLEQEGDSYLQQVGSYVSIGGLGATGVRMIVFAVHAALDQVGYGFIRNEVVQEAVVVADTVGFIASLPFAWSIRNRWAEQRKQEAIHKVQSFARQLTSEESKYGTDAVHQASSNIVRDLEALEKNQAPSLTPVERDQQYGLVYARINQLKSQVQFK